MRHIPRFGLCLSYLFILVFTITGIVQGAGYDQDTLQKMIERTKQEISNQKKKEKSVLSNLTKQQQELNKLENNRDQLKGKLTVVQKKVMITQSEQRELQKSLGVLEKKLSQRQQALNKRLVVAYKYGPQSYLEILFNARNYADLISRFSMIAYFIRNDLNSIVTVQEVKTQVNIKQQTVQAKKKQVEKELQKIVVLNDQVTKTQQKVASKVEQTKGELARIESNRQQLEKALDEYEQTSKDIGTQITKGEQNNPGGTLGSGKMIWPVKGRITSPFGWRYHPVLKSKKYHNGDDIAVPSGTPVHAADSGVVVVSGWEGGYGNYVAIDHGNGISTGYGHNSRLLVHRGERVVKGQVIALSGSTGLSTGPHVHFEVRRNGEPIDPLPYLPE